MEPTRIPVAGPSVTDLEVSYVAQAAREGWYETAGVWPARFERAFAEATGRQFAVSLPSCTAGLHLALAALGVGPGDEVVVPESTWIATAAPIDYVGATPVFADVDPVTWCLTAETVRPELTPRTRAVIAVDLYGSMPGYDGLEALCAERGIALIEDAAEAVGSAYHGRPAGGFGVAAVFSFHGSKTLTTGEGGMLVTSDPAFHARVMKLRDHGRAPGDTEFFNQEVAFKYKMSALQAAFGVAQLERLSELVQKKRWIVDSYRESLAGLPLVLNAEPHNTVNSYWMATAILADEAGVDAISLRGDLAAAGADTRPFFHPLSTIPAYAGRVPAGSPDRHPVAVRLARKGLNLPSALNLDQDQVARVAAAVRAALTRR